MPLPADTTLKSRSAFYPFPCYIIRNLQACPLDGRRRFAYNGRMNSEAETQSGAVRNPQSEEAGHPAGGTNDEPSRAAGRTNDERKRTSDGAKKDVTDFSKGPVWKAVIRQAIPLTVAQLIHLLYHVVDRVYIGHMGDETSIALTGVGLTFPIVTLLMAFAALF